MRIVFHECKKAFTSPILIGLFLLFSAFNIFLIADNTYFKDELKIANELSGKYGEKITAESLVELEEDLQQEVITLNQIASKHIEQDFTSANEFINYLRFEDHDLYSKREWKFFTDLQVKEMYLNRAKNIDDEYERIDWKVQGEGKIEAYHLSGEAAQRLKKEYKSLATRFQEMKDNAEHKVWFFLGTEYKMHSFLFRTIFGHLIFESMILIVLATALITNFEFENKTHLVVYPTKRGRLLMKDKLAASIVLATTISILLLLITLGTYFLVFDYSNLWGSSISSVFNWEYSLPYVAWWDLSFLSFLLGSVLIVYLCMLLFSAVTFVISVLVKNSYFTFFLFVIFFALSYMLPAYTPTSSKWLFYTGYTPSTLVMNPHMFFMGNAGFTLFKYYELTTICVWTMIIITTCIFCLKMFNKQEIR